ncbi:CPBP family intramembrane glutamic endopeptidase [Pseudidiomarina sediminum]|uniref:CPBP family intramembrane glutamic endopeptidase n=1 Tax=Pseudidiomarina sediminum TaxID=431675 RepID=UPI001C9376DB|nr:type II CAAX endopeptidase family protein [Pseudidiomarina sediminum]MBY6064264.1 CPBP family intramembrane metalloprotease [Pseudidiomarina sediminum]
MRFIQTVFVCVCLFGLTSLIVTITQTALAIERSPLYKLIVSPYILTFCVLVTLLIIGRFKTAAIFELAALRSVSVKELFWSVVVIFVFIVTLSSILYAFDAAISAGMYQVVSTNHLLVAYSISVVVLAPISEELLFRGILFTTLKESGLGLKGAIVITSLAFILMHDISSFASFVHYSVITGLLCALRVKTNSVIPGIIGHSIVNAALIAFAISATGF